MSRARRVESSMLGALGGYNPSFISFLRKYDVLVMVSYGELHTPVFVGAINRLFNGGLT